MTTPSFQVRLPDSIRSGLGTAACYDGACMALTCATVGGKLFLYSPEHTDQQQQFVYLSIQKTVTALASGRISPKYDYDILVIGTSSTVQAYDVQHNSDLFYKDFPGGVASVLVNSEYNNGWPPILLGGKGSVCGLSADGSQDLWTVTSDTATALALVDVDGDGQLELVVGTADSYLRMYKKSTLVEEVKEADRVVALAPLGGSSFAYGLANGTTGSYHGTKRKWRVKSKHTLVSLLTFDVDGDGVLELVSGWSNGKVEARKEGNGDVVMRDTMSAGVAALVRMTDKSGQGPVKLIACAVDGEIRGYVSNQSSAQKGQVAALERKAEEMMRAKQELLYELHCYESLNTIGFNEALSSGNIIPADTAIEFMMEVNTARQSIDLVLLTASDALLRGTVVFAEKVFEGESSFVFPRTPTNRINVPLRPQEDTPIHMLVKVFIGTSSSSMYQVMELDVKLPKYSMYALMPPDSPCEPPKSSVSFFIKDRATRLAMWLQGAFITPEEFQPDQDVLDIAFTSLRDGRPLVIQMNTKNRGEVIIRTDNMALASDLIQDIASNFNIIDLNSKADFPMDAGACGRYMQDIEQCQAMQQHLLAESADSVNAIKALVVKAEDARLLKDPKAMRSAYSQLQKLNHQLIQSHSQRETIHSQLVAAQKGLNTIIQHAAELRVGQAKAQTLTACHDAIQSNSLSELVNVVKNGGTMA